MRFQQMRFQRGLSRAALVAVLTLPVNASAQAAALGGLLSNATDINFFWILAGAPHSEARPEGDRGANGLGFELAFLIPGGTTRDRVRPSVTQIPTGKSCEAQFIRGELKPKTPCADTSVKAVKRTNAGGVQAYQEDLDIQKFAWTEPEWRLEIGIGFTQTGAFVSRRPTSDIRVSLRQAPSLSAYATYVQDAPILGALPFSPSPYVGIRTGLATLIGGRSYSPSSTITFDGETFQLGPVVGLVAEVHGVNLFVEGAYMWCDFKSLGWGTTAALSASLPRRLDLSGGSIAAGIQFSLKPGTGK